MPAGAARAVAEHRDGEGALLDARTAGVELINVLRPTVANARYVAFSAMAMQAGEDQQAVLRSGGPSDRRRFALEVRRFFPFIPFIGGRVLKPFAFRGRLFGEGEWVLMDLYGTNRDPRLWRAPDRFDPDRFRGEPACFRGEPADPPGLVSHGSGSAEGGHRCPGESISQVLVEGAAGFLAGGMHYRVPPQDLTIDHGYIPARPRSGFVMSGVRPR